MHCHSEGHATRRAWGGMELSHTWEKAFSQDHLLVGQDGVILQQAHSLENVVAW